MNNTGEIYGKYSFGNTYEEMLNEQNIKAQLVPIVRDDLRKASISNYDLDVMDVGIGRQALALYFLGARSVSHFDISERNVKAFSDILKKRYKNKPITTTCVDLCETAPPREKFDFVYLNGIVHHFPNTAKGLRNCADAVRLGGKIWVYFYRSGTFKWFICSMIRALVDADFIEQAFISSALIYADGDTANYITSRIMEDFFVSYINLYTPFEYTAFMKLLGFEVCGNDNLSPLCRVNHECLYHSATLVFKRNKLSDITNNTDDLLLPSANINQLDPLLYEDDRPKKSIELFNKFKDKVKNPIVIWSTLLALHKIASPQYYNNPKRFCDYDTLNKILKSAIKINF